MTFKSHNGEIPSIKMDRLIFNLTQSSVDTLLRHMKAHIQLIDYNSDQPNEEWWCNKYCVQNTRQGCVIVYIQTPTPPQATQLQQ